VTTPALHIQGLELRLGSRVLLHVPRLHVQAGERVAIVGANGAGKSTLLRLLAGFVPEGDVHISGQVQVLGQDLLPLPRGQALRALRAQLGVVHQGLHLVGRLTARENVLIGALARCRGWRSWARLYPAPLRAEADAALAAVGLLARADERVDGLSGGERQKISIARMRLQQPRLVLADEPTANLDPSAAAQACSWLQDAAAATPGSTLITVVHQLALLPQLADRVIGLQQGCVVVDRPLAGTPADVLTALYQTRPTPLHPQPQ
jgi:phosphonate transport system ATP-binding protein